MENKPLRLELNCRIIKVLAFLPCVYGALLQADQPANDWRQWRGPTRDCKVEGPAWPSDLKGISERWRVSLGPSYSGPIVTADRVFVTETKDKKTEWVHALDRSNGKELWRISWEGSMAVPFFAKSRGDWIRSTPAADEDSLYVGGIRDVLVCLNAKDGSERWRVDFVNRCKTELPAFGFVSSPLIVGDALYVQAGAAVHRLNKKTGETVWRSMADAGGMYGSAFSSVVLAKLDGRDQIVVQTREKLAGLDTETGKVLWSQEIPSFRGMNIVTPTVYGDSVLTSAYGGRTHLFKFTNKGDAGAIEELWSSKKQGNMSSPVVIGDHLYLHMRNQRLCCIDLKTGRTTWTSTPFGEYWSMAVNGDRILALDERGELLLIQADPNEFKLIDRREIGKSETWGHLAVCGDELFVRELNAMTVYKWTAK